MQTSVTQVSTVFSITSWGNNAKTFNDLLTVINYMTSEKDEDTQTGLYLAKTKGDSRLSIERTSILER